MGALRRRVPSIAWAIIAGLALTTCAQATAADPSAAPPPRALEAAVVGPRLAADSMDRLRLPIPQPVLGPILHPDVAYAVLPQGRYLPIFDEPSGRRAGGFDPVNPWRQAAPFLVTDVRRDRAGKAWLKVLVPARQNGTTGWVPRNDVKLVQERERIVVDLSQRTLWHFRNGHVVHRFSVAIGAPGTPTPTGIFYVWAHVPQASPFGPYGSFVLGLSGWSETVANGRMAIHGTADPTDRGRGVSHGCIRVYNPQMRLLRHVPMGTPVIIRP